MRRARREIEQADRILYVVDSADADAMTNLPRDLAALSVPGNMITVVLNKSDLSSVTGDVAKIPPEIAVSASRGNKIDVLRAHLIAALGYHPEGTGAISARRRHLDALQRARQHLYRACAEFDDHSGAELVAEELKLAHEAVGEVTGRFSSDDLLGRVFSTFCIGK
jgi:tRNA modification GTPase